MTMEKGGGYTDQLIRQTRIHHVELSSMADVKANILLTMASVVLTLSLRYISDELLKWPILMLITFCLLTIVLATYAVMPKLPLHLRHRDGVKIDDEHFNPLFFGDFTGLTFEEYETMMKEVMSSPASVYKAQIREIYLLGLFLAKKKYRFVRLAYIAFIIGFVASGVTIILKSIYY